MSLGKTFWTAAFSLVLLAGPAEATSALYVTDAQQAELSTAIVVATVGEARTSLSERYHRAITRTELKVEEVLYGAAPAELSIEQFGGTVGERTWYVPGDARFERGERCVLFLRLVEGQWFLTAMEQSKYARRQSPRLGTTLHRELSGGMFVRDATGHLVEFHEPVDRPLRRMKAFKALLADLPAPEAK